MNHSTVVMVPLLCDLVTGSLADVPSADQTAYCQIADYTASCIHVKWMLTRRDRFHRCDGARREIVPRFDPELWRELVRIKQQHNGLPLGASNTSLPALF
jgi:hypothetical protein